LKRVKGRSLFIIECIDACKGAEPILTKCNEAETERGGAYLIFSVLKRVKGRGLFYLSAMKQKQQRGGVYLIFSVVKHVKGRSLFNI
jgi:hypothetical protein